MRTTMFALVAGVAAVVALLSPAVAGEATREVGVRG